MNLKTATWLALIGVSAQFLWSLVVGVRFLLSGTGPLLYRLSLVPSVLFHIGLIAFFVTLLVKQQSGPPA